MPPFDSVMMALRMAPSDRRTELPSSYGSGRETKQFDHGGLVVAFGPPERGEFKIVVDGVAAGSTGEEELRVGDVAASGEAVERGDFEPVAVVGVHTVGEEEFGDGGSLAAYGGLLG